MRLVADIESRSILKQEEYEERVRQGAEVPDSEKATRRVVRLEIKHVEKAGYYLFYLDKDDKVISDGWHETKNEAKAQAEFEFTLAPPGWYTIDA